MVALNIQRMSHEPEVSQISCMFFVSAFVHDFVWLGFPAKSIISRLSAQAFWP